MGPTYKYDGSFKPVDELPVICMYMAQTPPYYPPEKTTDKNDWEQIITTTQFPIYATPSIDLVKLLEAIQGLQGQTAEIYRLKALAFEIKAKLAEPVTIKAQNEQSGTK